MAANEYRDRVVDEVTDKVLQRPGTDVGEEQVREAAEAAVDDLAAAPVQTFTPLLAENEVVSEIHAGELGDGDEDD